MRKILILSANPKNTTPLRLEEERREIEEARKRSQYRDQFKIVTRSAVRVRDLWCEMLDYEPNIVHFSGHGMGTEGLVFEDNFGMTHPVSGEALASLFELFRGTVECVLLNACYSEVQAQAIHQHVDYVIGMNQLIGDVAGIDFAKGFYDALFAGKSYDDAFKMGCSAIQLQGNQENLRPVIKSRPSSVSFKKPANFVVGKVTFQGSRQKKVRLKEPPSLLPYLVNRSEQELELGKALKLLLKLGQTHPLVCIIHGNEFQSHDKFLERLQKSSLPRLLKLDPTQTINKYYLKWPSGLKNLDELRERLCNNLVNEVIKSDLDCPEKIDDTLKEIKKRFDEDPSPIIIHTHILTQDWQQQGFEILNKLLEFWDNWPDLITGQRLIVCVFIKYTDYLHKHTEEFSFARILNCLPGMYKWHYYQRINKKIYTRLKVLDKSKNKDFKRLSYTILPKLTDINRKDVEDWVRSKETEQFIGEEMIQRMIDEVREIYRPKNSPPKKTIPMENLADALMRLLKLVTNYTYD